MLNLEKAAGTTKDTKDTKGEGLAKSKAVIWRVGYSDGEPAGFRPLFSGFSCFSCLSWFNLPAVSKVNGCRASCERRMSRWSLVTVFRGKEKKERYQGYHGRCGADYRCCLPALAGFVSPHSMDPGARIKAEGAGGRKEIYG